MRRQLALSTLLIAAFTEPVAGQSGTPLSAQASIIFQGLSGDAYEGVSGGIGLEGQMRRNFNNGRSLGAGLQYSRHSFAEGFGIDGDLSLLGLFLEPRIILNQSGTRSAPYASLRLAFLRQSTTVDGNGVSASGIQINGGGGILVVANARTNIDIGATIGAVKFGNYSTGVSAGSGLNFVLRVGVSLALGQ
jgi:hypothetical protein